MTAYRQRASLILILRSTDPIPRPPSSTLPRFDDDFAKYTVATLREQLEEERRDHDFDLENANREILSLRSQLARREAELESCIYHTGADRNMWHSIPEESPSTAKEASKNNDANRRIPVSSLSREEMIQIFGIADVRNRSLERDIHEISDSVSEITDNATCSSLIFFEDSSNEDSGPA